MAADSTMSVTAEHIVKRHLRKTAKKNWRRILCDIDSVSSGIKPSFLYDYSSIEPVKLSKMVADLAASGLAAKNENLKVLSLEQDTFLANIPGLWKAVEELHKALREGRRLAVDVSARLEQPGLLDGKAVQQLIDHTRDILMQLRGIRCTSDAVLELKPKHDWNFSSVFGVLLGYPVVYWYDDIENASNCLSMVPLRVYKVTFEADGPQNPTSVKPGFPHPRPRDLPQAVNGTTSNFSPSEHSVYSFSVPEALVPHFQDRIDDWFRGVQEKTHNKLEMTCNSVTLPVVAL